MKSFRILAILYPISGFCLESTNAQVSHKMSYNLLNESTAKSLGNWDTSFDQNNGVYLFRMTCLTSPRKYIIGIPNSIFLSTNRNYSDLISIPILFNDKDVRLTTKSTSMAGSGNSVTFNGKWESLTGKSIIDTSRVYYSPLKRTNNPTFSDNHFYRATANIFNFVMNTKYPSLNAPK